MSDGLKTILVIMFSVKGVNVLKMLESGDLLVGSGSGTLALCSKNNFKIVR